MSTDQESAIGEEMAGIVLTRLATDLESLKIEYMLMGGSAVWIHTGGKGRAINDIDILVPRDCDVVILRKSLVEISDDWYKNSEIIFIAGAGIVSFADNLTGKWMSSMEFKSNSSEKGISLQHHPSPLLMSHPSPSPSLRPLRTHSVISKPLRLYLC